jgi:lipoate-protein ligase B
VPERIGKWFFIDLETVAYQTAWKLQKTILEAKKKDHSFPDVALFLEHHPVFTLGRRGGRENLKVSECVINESGIEIIRVERGGDITYHGPGQLVGYPVIHLQKNRLKVVEYVEKLEQAMIQAASQWNVEAGRNALNRGVWVGMKKLGSVGIAVKRGISFHGFALNVNVSLEPYTWINPCGLHNVSMTSMALETSGNIVMEQVRKSMREQMASIFKIRWEPMTFAELDKALRVSEFGVQAEGIRCEV